MKTLLNLTAVLTLALTANMASADVDYDDMLDDAQEAYQHAAELQQIAANLPSGFPDRAAFQSRTTSMRNDLLDFSSATADDRQWSATGTEFPAGRSSSRTTINFYRTNVVQWIENHARDIERNYDGSVRRPR